MVEVREFPKEELESENAEATRQVLAPTRCGLQHVRNISMTEVTGNRLDNKFATDTDAEIEAISEELDTAKEVVILEGYAKGGPGADKLADVP